MTDTAPAIVAFGLTQDQIDALLLAWIDGVTEQGRELLSNDEEAA